MPTAGTVGASPCSAARGGQVPPRATDAAGILAGSQADSTENFIQGRRAPPLSALRPRRRDSEGPCTVYPHE